MNESPADNPTHSPGGPSRLLARSIGAGGLADNTTALAQRRAQALREEETILLFRVGGERFALPAGSVRCVFPACRVRPIPHRTRPPFRGLCCHEGEILLTGLLHVVLDMPGDVGAGTESRRMIVIGDEHASWAFEVDAVDGVRRADPLLFRPAPATIPRSASNCTVCLVPLEDGDAALLDAGAIHAVMERSIR